MGSVPITAGSGTPIRTFSNSGVDGGAHQQVMTLADETGDLITSRAIPQGTEDALMVRTMPSQITRTGFSDTLSNAVDADFATIVVTGSGQSVNQSNSNLVLTTGTTANSETIIRSKAAFSGAVRFRIRNTISQRIANQSFIIELVDVIQDAASITINSATSVTVTFTTNPFTAASVGQSMYLGAYSGSGTFVPGRYAIASVSGQTVTYTVSGFAAGSGTCSVFGYNYHHLIYNGTSNITGYWDTQRKGWNSGDTAVNLNTSASPGHLALMAQNDMHASIMDATVTSNISTQFIVRGSRVENVPDNTTMRLQIRVVNGSTAPASTTTWSIGHVAVSNWSPLDVAIQDARPQPNMSALPVQVASGVALNASSQVVGAVGVGATTRSSSFITSTGTNAAVVAKASAGDLQTLVVTNSGTAVQYLKVYNATSVTLGTTAAVLDIPIPATGITSVPLGPNGLRMTTGIAFAITGAAGTTNNTANATGVSVAATYV